MPLKAGQVASWDSRGVLRGGHPRAVKIRWSCRCAKTGLQRAPSSLCWASFLPVSMGTDGDEWRLILVCIGAGKKKGWGLGKGKEGGQGEESLLEEGVWFTVTAHVLAGGMRQTSLRQTSLRHPRGHEWKRTRKAVVTSHVPGALCGWTVWLEPKGKGSSAPQEWSRTGVRVWQIHWIHSTDIFWVPAVCQALCGQAGGTRGKTWCGAQRYKSSRVRQRWPGRAHGEGLRGGCTEDRINSVSL